MTQLSQLNPQQSLEELRERARNAKCLFFDMDGTLLSNTTHQVPESAQRCLEQLRAAGYKLYIASGRQPREIGIALKDKFEFPFDGYLTMSGSYCEDAGEPFRRLTIPREDVAAIVQRVQEGAFHILVSELNRTYCDAPKADIICKLEADLNLHYEPTDISQALEADVYQFCGFLDGQDDHLITDVAPHVFTTRWHPLFCDIIPKGSGKDEAIRVLCERHDWDISQAIAFGDGENDAAMLAACGVGVAMGNGDKASKAAANFITNTVDDDGIAKAVELLGLL